MLSFTSATLICAVEVFIFEADFLLEVVVFLVRVLRGVAGVAVVEDLRGINVKFVWTPSL